MIGVRLIAAQVARLRGAWINDLQGGGLETRMDTGSPGSHSVD